MYKIDNLIVVMLVMLVRWIFQKPYTLTEDQQWSDGGWLINTTLNQRIDNP